MRARLGDTIDDYCVKCKRMTNHAVVSLMNDEPAKVRCRTCHGDHDYRREQIPPTKAELRKAALFKEVLERMGGTPGDAPVTVEVPEQPAQLEANGASAAASDLKTKRAKARK